MAELKCDVSITPSELPLFQQCLHILDIPSELALSIASFCGGAVRFSSLPPPVTDRREDEVISFADELGLPADEVVRLWAKAQPHNLFEQMRAQWPSLTMENDNLFINFTGLDS